MPARYSDPTVDATDALFTLKGDKRDAHPPAPVALADMKRENGVGSDDAAKSINNGSELLPFYRRGGMHIFVVGIVFNMFVPIYVFLSPLPAAQIKAFPTALAISSVVSALPPTNMKGLHCIFVVPFFMLSLFLSLCLDPDSADADTTAATVAAVTTASKVLVAALVLTILKVNICMSVCLHRYAAHHAFKCGPVTSVWIQLLGCLANQGGPIWWASQHRCHHKYCDVERDPHSPHISGMEGAFDFFSRHPNVNEEFVPKHLDSTMNRIIDTWSIAVVSMELIAAYAFFGSIGLFVSHTSGWVCQSITLWFNIANHPTDETKASSINQGSIKGKCLAVDENKKGLDTYYLPFYFLDGLRPIFLLFVMEGEHKHHHDHAQLAKRSWYDVAYWGFIKPLEVMGLVWDVHV